MIVRLIALLLMTGAVVFASVAVGVSGWARPSPSVVVANGSRVEWVLPGGLAWQAGIRPGQSVVRIEAGVEEQRWAIATADDAGRTYTASYASMLATLRDVFPLACLALVLAIGSWLLVRSMAFASAVGVASLALGAQALVSGGVEAQGTILGALALGAPVIWFGAWAKRRRRATVVYGGLATITAAVWVYARLAAADLFAPADLMRQGTMWSGAVGSLLFLDWQRWRGRLVMLDSRRAADVFAVVVLLSMSIVVALITEVPIVFLVAGVGVSILIYPAFRRRIATAIDDILLGELRQRASMTAIEDERGRIARDLHDAPLQEISAVIRQLDGRPDTQREADLLRQAAGHLRRVTTELRPPVLDDLGLHAALAYLADRARSQDPHIQVLIDITPSDPFPARAPAEVELAVFRIVQEAVDNALRHAHAKIISIQASMTPREVAATVTDDGVGIAEGAVRAALVAGHAGLAGMAERASLIGATLRVSAHTPRGTEVEVQWQAQS